ncbi:unnamed protein product [Linum tenue]|uniref:NET domain-containing protein n=1 Tax=Linum tenue TaxID=586396 RepID=A0AAV0NCY2_9ROSI|nr:unnamed protein product [Linum tenue]
MRVVYKKSFFEKNKTAFFPLCLGAKNCACYGARTGFMCRRIGRAGEKLRLTEMKETPVSREDAQTKEGPDYFAYYASQVKELISQEIDFPLSTIESTGTRTGEGVDHDVVEQRGFSGSRSLFSNSIGAGVSEYKKERLNALLPQAASALKPEVDEMLDPVISMRQLQEKLWNRDSAAGKEGTKSDGEEIADNIPQVSSSSSSSITALVCPIDSRSSEEGDDDLEFLLGTDSTLVEESIKKYSDELLSTLAHMEKKLEELLDSVASTCRPMTSTEKQQLQRMIRNLPPANFDRIADIVQRHKPIEAQQCEEIVVNMEQEDTTTLWRLYYYVQVVERAKKLVP